MPVPLRLSCPHLLRDDLPTIVTKQQCYVVRPDSVVLGSMWWSHTLQNTADGSIVESKNGITFSEVPETLEQLRDQNASTDAAIMFELRITCSDAEMLVFAFVSKDDLGVIDRLKHLDDFVAKYGHPSDFDSARCSPTPT